MPCIACRPGVSVTVPLPADQEPSFGPLPVDQERPFGPALAVQGRPFGAATRSPGPTSTARVEGPSPFAKLVAGLGSEVQRGEAVVQAALAAPGRAGSLGPAELIALQAGVYRWGQAVDLAVHLVDRATASVKTVVQGQ